MNKKYKDIVKMIKAGYRFKVEGEKILVKMLESSTRNQEIKNTYNKILENRQQSIDIIVNNIKVLEFDLDNKNILELVEGTVNYLETLVIDYCRKLGVVRVIVLVDDMKEIDLEKIRIDSFWDNPFMSDDVKNIKLKLGIA